MKENNEGFAINSKNTQIKDNLNPESIFYNKQEPLTMRKKW